MKITQFRNQYFQKRRVLALTTLTVLVITLLAVGTSAADSNQDEQLTASTPAMINYQGVVQVDGQQYWTIPILLMRQNGSQTLLRITA